MTSGTTMGWREGALGRAAPGKKREAYRTALEMVKSLGLSDEDGARRLTQGVQAAVKEHGLYKI